MMVGGALILTLFLAADITASKITTKIDIQGILAALQQQQEEQYEEHQKQVNNRYDYKADEDENNSRFGSLRPQEVENLIQQALADNDRDQEERQNEPYVHKNKRQHYEDNDQVKASQNLQALWQAFNRDSDSKSEEEVVNKNKKNSLQKYQQAYMDEINQIILLDPSYKKPRYQKKKKSLLPNTLHGSNYPFSANRDVARDLNDYSKVYVILNVDAIQKSKTQNSLKDLVSAMLKSSSSGDREYRTGKKERRYKGFLVNDDDYRKAARDPKDDFVSKDAVEVDFKPKRLRSYEGGGRTPIPYIRQRGDIYEKEN